MNRRFDIVIDEVICTCLLPIVKYCNCDVEKIPSGDYSINAMFENIRPMPMNTDVVILLHYQMPSNPRVAKLTDIKLKVCDMLSHGEKIPHINAIMHKLRRHTNLPFSCPILEVNDGNFPEIFLNRIKFILFPEYNIQHKWYCYI